MKSKTLVFTSAILFFVCICVLFFFRLSPSFKIWDGYNVVYVDKTLSADEVNRTLSQAGITGIVSPLHNPFPPLPVMAPVQHTALYDNFSYNDLQTLFFSDKNDLFNLYYIPQRYKTKAAAALQRIHVLWGIDAPYSVPWILYFFCKKPFVFFMRGFSSCVLCGCRAAVPNGIFCVYVLVLFVRYTKVMAAKIFF